MMRSTEPFILASGSPRRRELLHAAGFNFDVIKVETDESYPLELSPLEVVDYIALQKLKASKEWLKKFVVVTADTLVFKGDKIFGKPKNKQHAGTMLHALSNTMHTVTTSVCVGYKHHIHQFNVSTTVFFSSLTDEEIDYYVEHYLPFDKAGSYGIQEWIGQVGIKKIEGSYTNVMGLPMHETFHAIVTMSKKWLN